MTLDHHDPLLYVMLFDEYRCVLELRLCGYQVHD